ncbi:ectoine/hydroxyectoine ABC transporter permease subunit EhuD [Cohnella rhizosphaerae]|uniref:Ectoine/hydroxyectoine ABC transporter permease subunit EhuD n=1 Tax=Cohnella rhizosphaerae TaxID=1457232 RepID=A0A9X4QSZ5_9BACL|nr:ectoine/hydroxyectoine ABC transporter permease subunit EhuD [Cohnella rhizosphaerae]MDG0809127.1 ectoine/hydroxyectoine ABC transporter permease subunit EhuD [Cohnella rhizosphaerae]
MWDWDYAWSILPELAASFGTAFSAMAWGFAMACMGGLILVAAGRSRLAVLRLPARGLVQFIRNTPLLVQLFFLYYSLPMAIGIAPSAFVTGVVGLGLHYSTYMSEVYRAGIEGVPKGQWEAAKALNYNGRQTWFTIILPQALPPMIPVMGNYLIVIFKDTPILSAITLVETLLTAKNLTSVSFRFFEPYTLVGVLFLIICVIFSFLLRRIEVRFNRHHLGSKQGASRSFGRRKHERTQPNVDNREVFPG